MTAELGLNLAGVERVLALESELDAAHERLAALEAQAAAARRELEQELDRVRRSMSADIVRYTASTALVRAADARSPFGKPGAPPAAVSGARSPVAACARGGCPRGHGARRHARRGGPASP